MKSNRERIVMAVKMARYDLERLDQLRNQSDHLGLSVERLDTMYEALADWAAVLEHVAKNWADPRDTPDWRNSNEGRALERLRMRGGRLSGCVLRRNPDPRRRGRDRPTPPPAISRCRSAPGRAKKKENEDEM